VKKILIAILSLLLVYGFLREYTVAKVLVVIAGAAAGYAIFRLPQRSIEAMKYPIIVLSFMVTVLFFFYPRLAIPEAARIAIVFVSFYAFILYLSGMEEKGQDVFKEITPCPSSSSRRIQPLHNGQACLPDILRGRPHPLPLHHRKVPHHPLHRRLHLNRGLHGIPSGAGLTGSGLAGLAEMNRYILLGSAFALLVTSFALVMKKSSFSTMLPFFGFLYIAMDILLVRGVRFSTGLLYQPALFIAILAPLAGTMLKTEGGKS
jgi:hypothetical protein